MTGEPIDDGLRALSSLDDPNRRAPYDHVVRQGEPVSREDAAKALGIDRSLAAYHLDKLVDEGLLVASFARPPGRGGPGAGRPAKHYERSDREVQVSVPPRDYQLAAELLARAAAADASGGVRQALEAAARELGEEFATETADTPQDLLAYLQAQGYEPYDDDGVVRLRNCPFHRLAQRHTEVICAMNHAMLAAVAAALGEGAQAQLDPAPGRCCVAFHPSRTDTVDDGRGRD